LTISMVSMAITSSSFVGMTISADGAKTAVIVIPTNEELVIAMDTMEIVKTLRPEPAATRS